MLTSGVLSNEVHRAPTEGKIRPKQPIPWLNPLHEPTHITLGADGNETPGLGKSGRTNGSKKGGSGIDGTGNSDGGNTVGAAAGAEEPDEAGKGKAGDLVETLTQELYRKGVFDTKAFLFTHLARLGIDLAEFRKQGLRLNLEWVNANAAAKDETKVEEKERLAVERTKELSTEIKVFRFNDAIRRDDVDALRILVKAGVDINFPNPKDEITYHNNNWSEHSKEHLHLPIYNAAKRGGVKVFKFLLENGARLDLGLGAEFFYTFVTANCDSEILNCLRETLPDLKFSFDYNDGRFRRADLEALDNIQEGNFKTYTLLGNIRKTADAAKDDIHLLRAIGLGSFSPETQKYMARRASTETSIFFLKHGLEIDKHCIRDGKYLLVDKAFGQALYTDPKETSINLQDYIQFGLDLSKIEWQKLEKKHWDKLVLDDLSPAHIQEIERLSKGERYDEAHPDESARRKKELDNL